MPTAIMGSDGYWGDGCCSGVDMLDFLDVGVIVARSGQELQKVSVLSQLPQLLHDSHDECIRRVVPKIRELLPVSRTEMQAEATDVFRRILKEEDVPNLMYAKTFLPTILNLMESRDPDIGEMWLETLLDVMELLSKETIRRDVLPRAIGKGQMTQSVASRLVSCRMLSRIATCLDTLVTQKELLPAVQALCQDVEYEVRACMCRQLHVIARAICLESIKLVIMPELVELINDEHASVRLAGLEALVSIVPLLDESSRSTVVIPLAVKLCQQAQTDDSTLLLSVSKYLGELLHGISGSLSASQKEWFFEFYRKLCCNGLPESSGPAAQHHLHQHQQQQRSKADVNDNMPQVKPAMAGLEFDRLGKDPVAECRANAATNFPAVLGLYLGVPLLEARLCESFSRLCKDPSSAVRQQAAHGFHEVARTLTAHLSLLARDLVCLLRDDCHEVLQGLIYGLSVTLETFGVAASPGRPGESKHFVMPPDFLSAVVACDASISGSNDWRLQETFLQELSALTKCCGSDGLYHRIIPMLFHKLATSARAIPVRRAAVRTLLVLLRSNRKLEQRSEMCKRIVAEFGRSESFRHRMLFIDICLAALDAYSHHFFVATFHEHLLRLADDAVPNVRLRTYALLPRIGRTARMLSDAVTANEIADLAARRLTVETDRDAGESLRMTCSKLGLPSDDSKAATSTGKVGSTAASANSTEMAAAESEEHRRTSEEQALLSEEEKDEEARKKAEKKSQRIASSKFVLDPKEKVKRATTSKIPMSPHLASNRVEQSKTAAGGQTGVSQLPAPASCDTAPGAVRRVSTLPHNGASPKATRRDQAAVTVTPTGSKATRTSMLPTAKRSGTVVSPAPSGGGSSSSSATVGNLAAAEPLANGSPSGRCGGDGSMQQQQHKSLHGSPALSKRPATTVGSSGQSQSWTRRKD